MDILQAFIDFDNRIQTLEGEIRKIEHERIDYCRDHIKEIKQLIPKKGTICKIINPAYYHERFDCYGDLFFRVLSQRFQPVRQRFYRVYPTVYGELLDENLNLIATSDMEATNLARTEKESETQIYLMIDKNTGYYKIGRSNNPLRRERTLQSQKPTIELIFHETSTKDKEKELHKHFKDKRIRGEWFDLSGSDIQYIKEALREN